MIPKKPAPAKAGVDTGFRKRSCARNKLERDVDSSKTHPALRFPSDLLERERDALADPDAHGGERELAAALFQPVHRRHRQARPRHAERVAERDRAALRIDVL